MRGFAGIGFALLAGLGNGAVLAEGADGGKAAPPSPAVQELRRHFLDAPLNALTFHKTDGIFDTQPVARGGTATVIPRAERPLDFSYEFRGQKIAAEDGLDRTFTNAMIIVKDGRIVFERYRNFTDARTRFLSMSMAKSITSILIGIAVDDGVIHSLDDQITAYVPELRGTAYDGVTLRNAMNLRSGVDAADEEEFKPGTAAAARREEIVVRNARPAVDEAYMVGRKAAPGKAFDYVTLDVTILGWVLERATGMPIAVYTGEKLWTPMGAEADAFWMVDGPQPSARPLTGWGFNATLRDYARIGLLMLNEGAVGGKQIVSKQWVRMTTGGTHKPLNPGDATGYQYLWWTTPGATTFAANGFLGQYLMIDPATRTVIVKLSYFPMTDRYAGDESDAFLRAALRWDAK